MIHQGDSLTVLRTMPDESVQCCVTSPPYWGLRDYGVDGQLGLEKTPEEYIAKMTEVFREVRRVLKSDGTLWLNIGDSYLNCKGMSGENGAAYLEKRTSATINSSAQCIGGKGILLPKDRRHPIIKRKELVGIPWLLAFALRADGWYLRSDIIWSKPNPMPESVKDRPTKAHEYLFLMSKRRSITMTRPRLRSQRYTATMKMAGRFTKTLDHTMERTARLKICRKAKRGPAHFETNNADTAADTPVSMIGGIK